MSLKAIEVAGVCVRRACTEDAAEIANVHLNSWREAYRNLLPKEYLDRLPLTFKARMNQWKKASTLSERALLVAESKDGIIGFSVFAPARDSSMAEHGELGAIYLLESYKGQGIGATLLKVGMEQLREWKHRKAYCWVLEHNPAIGFYEKSGAVFNGMEKYDEIGGRKVKELCYEWSELGRFVQPAALAPSV